MDDAATVTPQNSDVVVSSGDVENVDFVAAAMNQMSFQEREDAYNDIHGVVYDKLVPSLQERNPSMVMEEDPVMTQKKLKKFNDLIQTHLQQGARVGGGIRFPRHSFNLH